MPVERVSPQDAAKLLEQGWKYLDVRSEAEFEVGHPAGAFNVPLMHVGPEGRVPNPDFIVVVERSFSRGDGVVVGCRSAQRSLRAAEMMAERGFTQVVDMRGGFSGEKDAAGVVTYSGWQANDLPVATVAQPGRSYSELERSSK
jgi:rhodanese-related sulfurtransferase